MTNVQPRVQTCVQLLESLSGCHHSAVLTGVIAIRQSIDDEFAPDVRECTFRL